ncbi:MAG: hypothetical protein PHE03_13695, partial [Bacteroidales bacterium]|nr:hypothetical protein [Bacteroidales bacterium]
ILVKKGIRRTTTYNRQRVEWGARFTLDGHRQLKRVSETELRPILSQAAGIFHLDLTKGQ